MRYNLHISFYLMLTGDMLPPTHNYWPLFQVEYTAAMTAQDLVSALSRLSACMDASLAVHLALMATVKLALSAQAKTSQILEHAVFVQVSLSIQYIKH